MKIGLKDKLCIKFAITRDIYNQYNDNNNIIFKDFKQNCLTIYIHTKYIKTTNSCVYYQRVFY